LLRRCPRRSVLCLARCGLPMPQLNHGKLYSRLLPHLHVISCAVTQQYQRATRVTLARICSSKAANGKEQ
jgi:hypothetical protein